ncbi:MAG: hypothetical protein HYW24_03340 [Candidatus Aenigmarchaeota archaeon]|nr:hypothetical protein [Candidatus Aenigmarchaeota archaeon]
MMSKLKLLLRTQEKKELSTCPICQSGLEETTVVRKGIKLHGFKCKKCGEIVFPSSEVFKYEILSGKKNVREVRRVGNSIVIGLPKALAEEVGIKSGDLAYFEGKGKEIRVDIFKK